MVAELCQLRAGSGAPPLPTATWPRLCSRHGVVILQNWTLLQDFVCPSPPPSDAHGKQMDTSFSGTHVALDWGLYPLLSLGDELPGAGVD